MGDLLEVGRVSLRFGGIQALQDVSVGVGHGETLAVIALQLHHRDLPSHRGYDHPAG
jgi:hypothetical protein